MSEHVNHLVEPLPLDPYYMFCRSSVCEKVKLFTGTCAVSLLLLVVFIGVALQYCVLQIHPAANFVLLFLALVLLAYVEALHYAAVAVEKWDMSLYAERFPRAAKCQALVDTPEKVKKFLVGRQFFVIFVVFLIAEITTFPYIPKDFAGMPPALVLVLVKTGLPGVALVLTIGQLISQIFVEEFTLQFLNLYGCEFVIRLCLFAEWIGVCHFSWLLYEGTSRAVCSKVRTIQKSIDSAKLSNRNTTGGTDAEAPMSPTEKIRGKDFDSGIPRISEHLNILDLLKYFWSTCVTLGSLAVIFYGISIQAYVLPTPVPAAYVIAFVTLCILFYLEGLMIAIVGTQYWDPSVFKEVYPRAYKVHQLMNQPENVKRFIIGRQFFTVLTNFLLAQIFVFANWENPGINPILFFIGIKSGLCGVFVILAFAQLLSELLAAEYPLRFMNLYGSYSICAASLFFDSIGVGHAAWTIYYSTRAVFCGNHMSSEGKVTSDSKPTVVRVNSAEVIAKSPNHSFQNVPL